MTSKRRREYLPIGKRPMYDIYHSHFNRLRLDSQILNSGSEVPNTNTIIWDERNIEIQILIREGDDEGYYYKEGFKTLALKPSILNDIKEVKEQFKRYQQKRINSGYECPKNVDENWPSVLLEKRLKLEAELDVVDEEIETLDLMVGKIHERKRQQEIKDVLKYGLKGNIKLWGFKAPKPEMIEVIKEIDGQEVRMHNGILIILDDRSPYHGMSVIEYRKLCKEWKVTQDEINQKRLKQLQEIAKEEGRPIPQNLGVESPKRYTMKSLPPFPKWAKNQLNDE